jgi:hypothetical protein
MLQLAYEYWGVKHDIDQRGELNGRDKAFLEPYSTLSVCVRNVALYMYIDKIFKIILKFVVVCIKKCAFFIKLFFIECTTIR